MDKSPQFRLQWKNHSPNFVSAFTQLLDSEALVDVTLSASGKQIQAHRVVLSACSSYLQELFMSHPSPHPVLILKDVEYEDLRAVIDFMYYGEVHVAQDRLDSVVQTAAALHITGFANIVGSEPSGTSSEAEPLPGSSDERELSQAQNSPAKREPDDTEDVVPVGSKRSHKAKSVPSPPNPTASKRRRTAGTVLDPLSDYVTPDDPSDSSPLPVALSAPSSESNAATATAVGDRRCRRPSGAVYKIIKGGSIMQNLLLCDSIGYRYTVKVKTGISCIWRCTSRGSRKYPPCKAQVRQTISPHVDSESVYDQADFLFQGHSDSELHSHPAGSGTTTKVLLYSAAKGYAVRDVLRQPQDIVNHVLEGQKDLPGDLDVNNFKIAIRRALAKARSKE